MNIEILNMAKRKQNDRAIDFALPVLAIECEATPPLENYLDAYEETVLKLVAIGLSTRGIASTINATESLIEKILDNLDRKKYVIKETGKPWKLSEDGEKYLNGSVGDRESDNSQFGYMFVNVIKKDILPYFFQGDLNQAPLFRGNPLPTKLTICGDEEKTFEDYLPKRTMLKEAYKKFYRYSDASKQYDEGEITLDEAVYLFDDLDSFDEEDENSPTEAIFESNQKVITNDMFVRALNRPPKHVYLTIRVILDPQYPGGYRVDSPFDFNGIDNNYYLRQIQWLAAAGSTYVGNEELDSFLTREIRQLAPDYSSAEKDFSVFVLEKMPLLKLYKDRFNRVYEDMGRIYSLMQSQNCLLDKENIVSNISRSVVESLFNNFFRGVKKDTLCNISSNAVHDLDYYGGNAFRRQLFQQTGLDSDSFPWGHKYASAVIGRLSTTKGNSIVEKLFNVVVLNYYLGTSQSKALLSKPSAQRMYELADQLNQIRRKVSHDTEERFETKDYEFYMANVFTLINSLLEAYMEA